MLSKEVKEVEETILKELKIITKKANLRIKHYKTNDEFGYMFIDAIFDLQRHTKTLMDLYCKRNNLNR